MKYHLTIPANNDSGQIVTIDLPDRLSKLAAVSLQYKPSTKEAHDAVTQWLTNNLSGWIAKNPEWNTSDESKYNIVQEWRDSVCEIIEKDASTWLQHQQHESEYMQTYLDRQAAQEAGRLKQKIKSRLQKRMERTEAYAKQALLKFDIQTIPEWTVYVAGSGIGTGGVIPEALQGCFDDGMTLSEISDDAQRAMVAMDVLAFTQYVVNIEEPEAWAMFEISSALSEAIFALNDKERRKKYVKNMAREHGKKAKHDDKPYSKDLDALIEGLLPERKSNGRMEDYIFCALVGCSHGLITGIDLAEGDKIKIWYKENDTHPAASPFFDMYGNDQNMDDEEDHYSTLRRSAIARRITAINKRNT